MKEGDRKEGNKNGTLKIFVSWGRQESDTTQRLSNTRKEYKWGKKHLELCLNTDSLCCAVLALQCVQYFKLLGKNPVDKQYSQPTAMTSISGEVRHPLLFQ